MALHRVHAHGQAAVWCEYETAMAEELASSMIVVYVPCMHVQQGLSDCMNPSIDRWPNL